VSPENVKLRCTKCNTLRPLVEHRTICFECNRERKRAIAARKLSTAEGREANRAKAAAFRATEAGAKYQSEYDQRPDVKERRSLRQRVPEDQKKRKDRFRQSPEYRAMLSDVRAARKAGYWREWGQSPEQKAARAEWLEKWRRSPRGYLVRMVAQAKKRAKDAGMEFDLDPNTMPLPVCCEVTNILFDFEKTLDGYRTNPWAPSIDRRDSSKGYTKSNVQIVCWAYNTAKHEFSEDVLLKMARAIVARHPD
jgi:hypothetical protein